MSSSAAAARYGYSVYQAEYQAGTCCLSPGRRWRTCSTGSWTAPGPDWTSRRSGPCLPGSARDRTAPARPGQTAQEIVIGKPRYGLSWFRISFGRLQLKAYTKGEHVLRFEATVHNAKELRCRAAWTTSTRSSTG